MPERYDDILVLPHAANEGYGKAFVQADAPFVIGRELLGGAWTFGVNWSGSSKAYGATEPIDFDLDVALSGDPKENSAKYTQYGHARACSILAKAESELGIGIPASSSSVGTRSFSWLKPRTRRPAGTFPG